MGDYLLYGVELINDDSSMEAFARSVVTNLNLHYDSKMDYDLFMEVSMELVSETICYDISRTGIDYEHLMHQWREEIGNLLYEADNHGCDILKNPIHFFGDGAKESFQALLICYISLNLLELTQSEQKEATEEKWVLTDEDTFQYRRRLKDVLYELYQIGERIPAYVSQSDERFGVIHTVVHTSEIEIKNILTTYDYESLDELKNSYGADWEGVLAECESEIMASSGYGYINQDDITWKDAVALINELIGPNSMEKRIRSAKTKTTRSNCTLDQKMKTSQRF